MQDDSPAPPTSRTEVPEPDVVHRSARGRARPDESVDPTHRISTVTESRGLRPLRLTAVAFLLLCATGFAGWLAPELIQDKPVQEALVDYVYGSVGLAQAPSLPAPANSTDQAIWGRSGMGGSPVDLSTWGFKLRSTSIVPTSGVLTTLMIYVNAEGNALALTVRPNADSEHASITKEARSDVTAFTWIDDRTSYKLVSDMPADALFMIAAQAHKQTCQHRSDVHPRASPSACKQVLNGLPNGNRR